MRANTSLEPALKKEVPTPYDGAHAAQMNRQAATPRPYITASLLCAASVPFVYFGAQLLGASFYPNFSVLRDVASTLGSDVSTQPAIFNAGISLAGLLAIGGAAGLYARLRESQVSTVLCVMTCLALLSFAAGSFWAASHPLPDPRHDPGPLSAGMFTSPLVACLTARQLQGARSLRVVCAVSLLVFIAIVGAYSGFMPIARGAYEGALQRVGALTLLAPLSAMSWWLFLHSRRVSLNPRTDSSRERTQGR
jgi:hypothetical protein